MTRGPIDGIGNAIAVLLGAVGRSEVADFLAAAGPVLLGSLVPVLAVFLVYRRGVGSWMAHDALERVVIRREAFGPPGHSSARGESVLLVGGLIAVVLAALVVPPAVLGGWLVTIAVAGLVVRLAGPPVRRKRPPLKWKRPPPMRPTRARG